MTALLFCVLGAASVFADQTEKPKESLPPRIVVLSDAVLSTSQSELLKCKDTRSFRKAAEKAGFSCVVEERFAYAWSKEVLSIAKYKAVAKVMRSLVQAAKSGHGIIGLDAIDSGASEMFRGAIGAICPGINTDGLNLKVAVDATQVVTLSNGADTRTLEMSGRNALKNSKDILWPAKAKKDEGHKATKAATLFASNGPNLVYTFTPGVWSRASRKDGVLRLYALVSEAADKAEGEYEAAKAELQQTLVANGDGLAGLANLAPGLGYDQIPNGAKSEWEQMQLRAPDYMGFGDEGKAKAFLAGAQVSKVDTRIYFTIAVKDQPDGPTLRMFELRVMP